MAIAFQKHSHQDQVKNGLLCQINLMTLVCEPALSTQVFNPIREYPLS